VKLLAKSLLAVGCDRHDALAILAFNSAEWFEAAMGGIMAGMTPAGIYNSNSSGACEYILNHCKARVVFVDCETHLQKIMHVKPKCAQLRLVVHWGRDCPSDVDSVISWKEFMALSAKTSDGALDERMRAMYPDSACYLSYTSGTTGPPKAVMFSHDNILWSFTHLYRKFSKAGGGLDMKEREISYLPLSHVAGSLQMFGQFCNPETSNSEVHFAFSDAMQGSLLDTLREVRPTCFSAVPRVWEKLLWSLQQQLQLVEPSMRNDPNTAKSLLGLENVKAAITGGAPTAHDILRHFDSIDLPIYEMYGMTENTGYSHLNYPGMRKIGSAGAALRDDGAQVCIDEGTSEVRTWSRGVMMGYLYMPEQSAAAFDRAGFLRTGDTGTMKNGFAYITGRIKELLITSGGENVSPSIIEGELKKQMPALSNVLVVGDRQKYLIALMTLKLVPGDTGGFSSRLDPVAALVDPACHTFDDVLRSSRWERYISVGVDAANANAISRAQHIRKFHLLRGDFSQFGPNPELTPLGKVMRAAAQKKYASEVEATYGKDFTSFPDV